MGISTPHFNPEGFERFTVRSNGGITHTYGTRGPGGWEVARIRTGGGSVFGPPHRPHGPHRPHRPYGPHRAHGGGIMREIWATLNDIKCMMQDLWGGPALPPARSHRRHCGSGYGPRYDRWNDPRCWDSRYDYWDDSRCWDSRYDHYDHRDWGPRRRHRGHRDTEPTIGQYIMGASAAVGLFGAGAHVLERVFDA